MESRVEQLGQNISQVLDALKSIGSREEDVDKLLSLANRQLKTWEDRLEEEKTEWRRRCTADTERLDAELERIQRNYAQEIVEGRKWVEEESQRLSIERLAFQAEQSEIVESIAKKREEFDAEKVFII